VTTRRRRAWHSHPKGQAKYCWVCRRRQYAKRYWHVVAHTAEVFALLALVAWFALVAIFGDGSLM
jgi:hypothetical protein